MADTVRFRVVKLIAKLRIAIAKKNTISEITQFSFLSAGYNRNTTQFDSQEGHNFKSCENYNIEVFLKKWSIKAGFWIFRIFQISYLGQNEPETNSELNSS